MKIFDSAFTIWDDHRKIQTFLFGEGNASKLICLISDFKAKLQKIPAFCRFANALGASTFTPL